MTTQKISVTKAGGVSGAWVNHGKGGVVGIYVDERVYTLAIASYENGESIPKLAVSLSSSSDVATVQFVSDEGVSEKTVSADKFARAVDRFLAELVDLAN
jgi:hypothetical protein